MEDLPEVMSSSVEEVEEIFSKETNVRPTNEEDVEEIFSKETNVRPTSEEEVKEIFAKKTVKSTGEEKVEKIFAKETNVRPTGGEEVEKLFTKKTVRPIGEEVEEIFSKETNIRTTGEEEVEEIFAKKTVRPTVEEKVEEIFAKETNVRPTGGEEVEEIFAKKTNVRRADDADIKSQLRDEIHDEDYQETKTANKIESVDVMEQVPSYTTNFTGYLTEKEFCMDTGKHIPNDARPKKVCFNCLGDHNIQDCLERKNFQAIARNRKAILGKRLNNTRYHEDVENKFGSFGSGISESLRFALGLREDEAPEFIYRMRVLGYPPGWLKDAEVRRSDVSLFDGNGRAMMHPDEEEGETDVSLVKYDPDKLISYPGFNVPFPSHIQDQYRELNYPKMRPHHSKEIFEKFMRQNKAAAYKRKKLKASDTPQESASLIIAKEMDVDNSEMDKSTEIEFNPPLPPELPAPPPPPSPPEVMIKEDGEISEDSDDSLPDESKSKKLKTLDQSETASFSPSPPKTTDLESTTKTNDNKLDTTQEMSNGSLISAEPLDATPVMVKKIQQHRSGSKGFTLGVSIPSSITPYKVLPKSEQWGNDVSDHILFENLPDALGTWKKMKGIMHTVKVSMQKLHDEDE